MNREIKVRGKSVIPIEEMNDMGMIHYNGWVYGAFVDGYIVSGVDEVTDEYIVIRQWCKVIPETVGQCTERKDKTDTEFCEGDVVAWSDPKDIWSIEFGEFGVPNVEDQGYQDYAFGFYLKPQHDLKEIEPFNMTFPLNTTYASQLTIIGNVYDNPELLND